MISDALLENQTLRTLNLASNDIGRDGAWEIAESLQQSTTLQSLHLGFDKSTRVLGERPNRIGDGGCVALAELVTVNRSLCHLDLARNNISTSGAKLLLQSLEQNDRLTSLVLGRGISRQISRQINDVLRRNVSAHGPYQIPDWQDIEAIRSVYR